MDQEIGRRVVGREAELALAATFLDQVRGGPAVLLFQGEAGIGKSTVWEAAVAEASRRSYRVLTCRPVEAEAQLSFGALGDLLASALAEVAPDLPVAQRRALDVALLRAESGGESADQRAVSLAVVATIRGIAAEGPLVVAVDDVQWLDAASARVLRFAIRRIEGAPVGVLLAQRSESGEPPPLGLERALTHTPFHLARLGPLSVAALHHILRTDLGTSFPRPTLMRLHTASGGNPFFALEMGRALIDATEGPAVGEGLPVPANLRELVRGRLARLPKATKDALVHVAALAHPSPGILQAGGVQLEDLEAAEAAGILRIGRENVSFTHPLLSSVLFSTSPLSQRREVHRRLAKVVSDAEERARHQALGTDGPDREVAASLEGAARAAKVRGATDAAAELAELAFHLTPHDSAGDRRSRAVTAADHHFESGATERAMDLLSQALALSAPGHDRAEIILRVGLVRGETEGIEAGAASLEEALLEDGIEPSLEATIRQYLGFSLMLTGDGDGARRHGREALRIAETADDPKVLALTLGALGRIEFTLGEGVQTELLLRGMAVEETGESLWADDAPSTLHAAQLMWIGQLDEARRRLLRLHQEAVARGYYASLGIFPFFLSLLECRAGDFGLATRYADEAAEAYFQSEREAAVATVLFLQAEAAAYLGDVVTARARAEEGLRLSRSSGYGWFEIHNLWVLGFVRLSLGDPAGAHEHLARAAELFPRSGVGEPGIFLFPPDHVEALVALGRFDEAQAFLDRFEARGKALDRTWVLATAARCRGLLTAARGEPEDAEGHLNRALKEHQRLAMPFELARTLLVKGEILRRGKQKRPAREALERAAAMFEQMGAGLWAGRAREELARIGGRTASPTELTPTERKVAEAVASGLTNRQAADRLFLSPHTIEANLKRIYRKLGVRSRTELARRLTEPG